MSAVTFHRLDAIEMLSKKDRTLLADRLSLELLSPVTTYRPPLMAPDALLVEIENATAELALWNRGRRSPLRVITGGGVTRPLRRFGSSERKVN